MFTVIIPLYNGIEYLSEAVNSVISQSFQDWSMLIGINGHGDNSSNIANKVTEIIGSDTRIKVIIQPPHINNKSMSQNNLMTYVTTEWVALLDADDIWLPGKLQKQVDIINTTTYEVIGTQCEYFGNRRGSPRLPLGTLNRKCTLVCNPLINSSVVLKSKYAKWDESRNIHIDYELWLNLDLQAVKMYNISTILVRHRLHNASFFNTQKVNPNILKDKFVKLFRDG
jgi:glycosyltransferase involved in cell wall biosynthesis